MLVTTAQESQSRAEKGSEKGSFNEQREIKRITISPAERLALRRDTTKCL